MNKNIKKIGISVIIAIILIVGIVIIIKKDEIAKDEELKLITISIFDKDNNNIYNENIETDDIYLIDVLQEKEELKVVLEDSDYGKYITSIMGIEQGDNYYWSYYINEEYATTGVSNCEIQSGNTYDFKIESFSY